MTAFATSKVTRLAFLGTLHELMSIDPGHGLLPVNVLELLEFERPPSSTPPS